MEDQRETASEQELILDGSIFKARREELNLSLADVSAETRILSRHIDSIEQNRWSELPHPAFTRGFISNYAQTLGLDSKALVAQFNRMQGAETKSLKETFESSSPIKDRGTVAPPTENLIRFGRPGIMFALVAAVVLIIFYVLINVRGNPLPEVLDVPVSAAQSLLLSDRRTEEGMRGEVQPSEVAAPDSAAVAQSGTEAQLVFWVMRSAQIRVTDATGKLILSGEHGRGEIRVTGVSPFHLQTDRVQNFDLNINGVPQLLRQNFAAGPIDEVLAAPASAAN